MLFRSCKGGLILAIEAGSSTRAGSSLGEGGPENPRSARPPPPAGCAHPAHPRRGGLGPEKVREKPRGADPTSGPGRRLLAPRLHSPSLPPTPGRPGLRTPAGRGHRRHVAQERGSNPGLGVSPAFPPAGYGGLGRGPLGGDPQPVPPARAPQGGPPLRPRPSESWPRTCSFLSFMY